MVALRQLVERGVNPQTVRGWVAARRLIRLHQGVFAVGHDSLRVEAHYLAAVLACGHGAVLSYQSAASLWGIRDPASALVDVTTPRRAGRRRTGLRIHAGEKLSMDEVTLEDGVPCTTVARTLLDLAAVLYSERAICAAIEASERRGLFDLRATSLLLARHRGRRGVAKLRRALASFEPEVLRARSETEARFFFLCLEKGLPRPLVNRKIDVGDRCIEVDFHWPAARLIVETDSPYHDTTFARLRDHERDAALGRVGWKVIRCRWHDIVSRPTALTRRIGAGLGA